MMALSFCAGHGDLVSAVGRRWVWVAALALQCVGSAAWAQSVGAPPASSSAGQSSRTGTLGAIAPRSGPIMTRDELRECMRQQARVRQQSEALTVREGAMQKEREAIDGQANDSAALRAEVDRRLALVRATEVKVRESNAAVRDWNRKVTELNEAGPRESDPRRVALAEEQMVLRSTSEALGAELSERAKAYEAAVQVFNDRAAARDVQVKAWNARNAEVSAASVSLANDRDRWATDCAGRRYREDDEIAIGQGK